MNLLQRMHCLFSSLHPHILIRVHYTKRKALRGKNGGKIFWVINIKGIRVWGLFDKRWDISVKGTLESISPVTVRNDQFCHLWRNVPIFPWWRNGLIYLSGEMPRFFLRGEMVKLWRSVNLSLGGKTSKISFNGEMTRF